MSTSSQSAERAARAEAKRQAQLAGDSRPYLGSPLEATAADRAGPWVRFGNVLAEWDRYDESWRFEAEGLDCWTETAPTFEPGMVDRLPEVRQWVESLAEAIRAGLAENCHDFDPAGPLPAFTVEVSELPAAGRVEVEYSDPSWGDFAVGFVIEEGEIVEVFGGD